MNEEPHHSPALTSLPFFHIVHTLTQEVSFSHFSSLFFFSSLPLSKLLSLTLSTLLLLLHLSFITLFSCFLTKCSCNHNTTYRCALFSRLSCLPMFEGSPSLLSTTLSLSVVPPPYWPSSPHPPWLDPSLVQGLAVRPSPVSAAAVISSGPSGGLLLTSQAWDRVTSSLNMMGLNQQCVHLNREGETKQLRGLPASK